MLAGVVRAPPPPPRSPQQRQQVHEVSLQLLGPHLLPEAAQRVGLPQRPSVAEVLAPGLGRRPHRPQHLVQPRRQQGDQPPLSRAVFAQHGGLDGGLARTCLPVALLEPRVWGSLDRRSAHGFGRAPEGLGEGLDLLRRRRPHSRCASRCVLELGLHLAAPPVRRRLAVALGEVDVLPGRRRHRGGPLCLAGAGVGDGPQVCGACLVGQDLGEGQALDLRLRGHTWSNHQANGPPLGVPDVVAHCNGCREGLSRGRARPRGKMSICGASRRAKLFV